MRKMTVQIQKQPDGRRGTALGRASSNAKYVPPRLSNESQVDYDSDEDDDERVVETLQLPSGGHEIKSRITEAVEEAENDDDDSDRAEPKQ